MSFSGKRAKRKRGQGRNAHSIFAFLWMFELCKSGFKDFQD